MSSTSIIESPPPTKIIRYFKGFEWTEELDNLFKCLEIIEKWKELAIRPASSEECPPTFIDLFSRDCDDLSELQRRCLTVRDTLNESLLQIETTIWDRHLVPKTSGIVSAGLGLFYLPISSSSSSTKKQDDDRRQDDDRQQIINIIPKGTTICFYTGHIHTFHSAKKLQDTSYLMSVLGNILVDAKPRTDIKARYINDPLDEEAVNCVYCPEEYRSAVVVTRDIHPGEELFVSYGDIYWSSQQQQNQNSGVQFQSTINQQQQSHNKINK